MAAKFGLVLRAAVIGAFDAFEQPRSQHTG
jgi:hypothetical protein